jgi:hypothetical protein
MRPFFTNAYKNLQWICIDFQPTLSDSKTGVNSGKKLYRKKGKDEPFRHLCLQEHYDTK